MTGDFREIGVDPRKRQIERWLTSEQEERDDSAETAFSQLFAATPRREADPQFIDRTVQLAWKARSRSRILLLGARIAAGLFMAASALAAVYALTAYAGGPLIARGATIAARLIVTPTLFLAAGLEWWSAVAAPASTIAEAIATPQAQVALVSGELVCGFALYAIHRLLRLEFADAVNGGGDRR
jgi:hypothetical protein